MLLRTMHINVKKSVQKIAEQVACSYRVEVAWKSLQFGKH